MVCGPAHQACYLCSLLFPTGLPLLGWRSRVWGEGERMYLLAPLLSGIGPPPWEENHHLPLVKPAGPSFRGQPAAGWPRPSGCLSKESPNGIGRLLLKGCDWGAGERTGGKTPAWCCSSLEPLPSFTFPNPLGLLKCATCHSLKGLFLCLDHKIAKEQWLSFKTAALELFPTL